MGLRCRLFGHVVEGIGRRRCSRCDEPVGLDPIRGEVSESEAVLLAALGEIKAIGVGRGSTHHSTCHHAPCIAERAIEAYWEIVLAPFKGPRS